ncbi:hypothetical protein N3K66_006183 [Trichothecium roseum]|uniref:Uncharacterized protein n=1 Tax=Trichothecium roseum TaxID=47278 RepID=A0ACC0UZZ7_9HYPO|nr:hypothetical protein N3K66_006183 [Trichothecium roseum]
MGGQSREGGKLKPLKAKGKVELSAEDKAEKKAMAEAERENKRQAELMKASILGKKGPLNTGGQGIKKSGKK